MIELPRQSAAAARAWTRLAPRLPLVFDAGGVATTLDLPGQDQPVLPADWTALVARLDSHPVRLQLDPALLPAEAVRRWPELAQVGAPEGLRTVLLDVMLEELSGLAEAWCGQRPEWDAGGVEPEHRLVVLQGGRTAGVVGLDDGGLAWLASQLSGLPARQVALDAVPVMLDLLIDRASLSAREMRDVGAGDVVVLDESPVATDGALAVQVRVRGTPGLRGRVLGGRLELLATLDGMMDKPEPLPAASLDDLPLPVEFLVGRLALPLSRLRELAPGQVLDLGLDVTTAVTLRINGQVVAEGELVRIAERTGVRIRDVHLARS